MTKPYFTNPSYEDDPMEDDLKILRVKYLNNHLLDNSQILNLSLDMQTIF